MLKKQQEQQKLNKRTRKPNLKNKKNQIRSTVFRISNFEIQIYLVPGSWNLKFKKITWVKKQIRLVID